MLKRIFDVIFSIIGLFFTMPIILFISILIKLDSRGPVFFIQERVGRNNKIFKMLKFRSMQNITDSSCSISIKGDARITKIGSILRKYKLDEIPELCNVLIGDMSFVGPRPDVPGYADKLTGEDKKVLDLRPGITGPASLKYSNEEELLSYQEDPVKYNNDVIYPDKVKINLEYFYNNSLWIDIKIIFATIFKITKS